MPEPGFLAAAAQLGGVTSVDEALPAAHDAVAAAGQAGARLVVLSELALSPYFAIVPDADPAAYALRLEDPRIAGFASEAARRRLWIVLPFAEHYNGRYFNSAAILSEDGRIADVYRKTHIPRGFLRDDGTWSNHEDRYFAAGERYPVVDTGFTRLGVLICYDRFFPEPARRLALQGATTIAYPSANRGHGSDWAGDALRTLVRARAYENACFVVSASKGGAEGGQSFIGNSSIVSPTGGRELAATDAAGPGLLIAECRDEDLGYARRRLRWEENRRPDLYTNLRAEAGGAPLRASVGAC